MQRMKKRKFCHEIEDFYVKLLYEAELSFFIFEI